jgi:hypothetical protein
MANEVTLANQTHRKEVPTLKGTGRKTIPLGLPEPGQPAIK